jgi:hypothetical protein
VLKDDVSVDENFVFLNIYWVCKIFSLEFIVSKIDIMSGGSNSLKPGQPRSTNINTVQTLLKAKFS